MAQESLEQWHAMPVSFSAESMLSVSTVTDCRRSCPSLRSNQIRDGRE